MEGRGGGEVIAISNCAKVLHVTDTWQIGIFCERIFEPENWSYIITILFFVWPLGILCPNASIFVGFGYDSYYMLDNVLFIHISAKEKNWSLLTYVSGAHKISNAFEGNKSRRIRTKNVFVIIRMSQNSILTFFEKKIEFWVSTQRPFHWCINY